ncbi:MAG: hypothetical protein IKU40_04545 [Clostridia bacterium]|nr:hypothetical protein [Clostridia bacterium]
MSNRENMDERTQSPANRRDSRFRINDISPDAEVKNENERIPDFSRSSDVFLGDITCAGACCGGKLITADPGTVVWAVKDCSVPLQSALQKHFSAVLHVPDTTFIPGSAPYSEKDGYTLYSFYLWDEERSLRELPADVKKKIAPIVFRELLLFIQEGQWQNVLTNYSPLVKKMQVRRSSPFFGALCCLSLDTVYVRFCGGNVSIRILPIPALNEAFSELYPPEAGGPDADFTTDLYAAACIYLILLNGGSEMKDVENLPNEENTYLLRAINPFQKMRPTLEEVRSGAIFRELGIDSRTVPEKKISVKKKAAAPSEPISDDTETGSEAWKLPFLSFPREDVLEKLKGIFGKESSSQTDATEV